MSQGLSLLEAKQKNRKVLAVTLFELQKIIRESHDLYEIVYRGAKFQYLVLVARYVGADDCGMAVFTDDTGVFKYENKRIPHSSSLSKGQYYQLTITLKSMHQSAQAHLQNIQLVQGNTITAHIAHMLQTLIQQKTFIQKQTLKITTSQNPPPLTTPDQKHHQQEKLYQEMKQWIERKGQFVYDEFVEIFGNEPASEGLNRLEDQGLVGNMGEGLYRSFI